MTCLQSAPKRRSAFCLAASLVLAGGAVFALPACAQANPETAPSGFEEPAPGEAGPLEGVWTAQTPHGPVVFHFSGSRCIQTMDGHSFEGRFRLLPDGRIQFHLDGSPDAERSGESRAAVDGRTLTLSWPDGSSMRLVRGDLDSSGAPQLRMPEPVSAAAPGSGQGRHGPVTPLEGRWVWAGQGPDTFGFVFSGVRFEFFQNGETANSGTFELDGGRIVLHSGNGTDDSFGFQLSGDRMSLTQERDRNAEPIPFVRRQARQGGR